MHKSTSLFIALNPEATAPVSQRFEKTLDWSNRHARHPLPYPEATHHIGGSSTHAMLYKFGHPHHELAPLTDLAPHHLRSLGGLLSRQRSAPKPLHVVGLVDTYSPYGSRRYVEQLLRQLLQAEQTVNVHLLSWHPLPRDFTLGLRELTSMGKDVTLAGVASVDSIRSSQGAKRYLDGIQKTNSFDSPASLHLPLTKNYHFAPLEDDAVFIFANHQAHSLDHLHDCLTENGYATHAFQSGQQPAMVLEKDLASHRFIMNVTTKPQYHTAVWGGERTHPYLESLTHPDSDTLLEMLLSPHFRDGIEPYKTIITLDEGSNTFDRYLMSYLKQIQSQPYACCFIDPVNPDSNFIITNQSLDPHESIYAQVLA